MGQPVQIVWFKRDLRVCDHPALCAAAAAGPVLPLYIVEPGYWALPDTSARQWAFVAESLADLEQALAGLGARLVVRTGDAVEVLERLASEVTVGGLWAHEETGNAWTYARDKRVAAWAAARGVSLSECVQSGVVRRLKSRDGWAAAFDAFAARPQLEAPFLVGGVSVASDGVPRGLGCDAVPCPGRQPGGRQAGLAALGSFLSARGRGYRYEMSSPVSAERACSRLSPYLAYGALSVREAIQAGQARGAEARARGDGWAPSMRSFDGRLHWRDHFIQKLEDEPRLEFENLHPAFDGLIRDGGAARLAAWEAGETGLPFVDAVMRWLRATGWANFRMRAMLMSVAAYHLWLPWRDAGLHLARMFTDYEPGIHWSQVQMQAGTTGINTIRMYNPIKQGKDQDPEAVFLRRWVPELAGVPDEFVHEPWAWSGAGQVLGRVYPEPVVDPVAAAKAAKEKVYGLRRSEGFKGQAKAIAHKHGSRKGRRSRPKEDRQLSLDL